MTEPLRVPFPPAPYGTPQEQLRQLYDYLYRLAELLNMQEERRKECYETN